MIEPWKESVSYIEKEQGWSERTEHSEYIKIVLKENDACSLPFFEMGEYYKNMELGEKYSLEELGL